MDAATPELIPPKILAVMQDTMTDAGLSFSIVLLWPDRFELIAERGEIVNAGYKGVLDRR